MNVLHSLVKGTGAQLLWLPKKSEKFPPNPAGIRYYKIIHCDGGKKTRLSARYNTSYQFHRFSVYSIVFIIMSSITPYLSRCFSFYFVLHFLFVSSFCSHCCSVLPPFFFRYTEMQSYVPVVRYNYICLKIRLDRDVGH